MLSKQTVKRVSLCTTPKAEKYRKKSKKGVDIPPGVCYYTQAVERQQHARVVELADSLDSGSSVLYGRAGSSPASRTKETVERLFLFL